MSGRLTGKEALYKIATRDPLGYAGVRKNCFLFPVVTVKTTTFSVFFLLSPVLQKEFDTRIYLRRPPNLLVCLPIFWTSRAERLCTCYLRQGKCFIEDFSRGGARRRKFHERGVVYIVIQVLCTAATYFKKLFVIANRSRKTCGVFPSRRKMRIRETLKNHSYCQ